MPLVHMSTSRAPTPMKKAHPLNYNSNEADEARLDTYHTLSSCESEEEIFPSEDELESVETEVILIELQVGFSVGGR